MKQKKLQKGIIALTTVLITGAVVLFIGLGMTLRSMIESDISLDQELSQKALVMATSCMEQALLLLANNSSYNGNETITIGTQTCSIGTITGEGEERSVQSSSNVYGYTSRLIVTVSDVTPPLQISSWQEVDNF